MDEKRREKMLVSIGMALVAYAVLAVVGMVLSVFGIGSGLVAEYIIIATFGFGAGGYLAHTNWGAYGVSENGA